MVIVARGLREAISTRLDWMSWMHEIMGLFLVVLSMVKLFNWKASPMASKCMICSENGCGLTPMSIHSSSSAWAILHMGSRR